MKPFNNEELKQRLIDLRQDPEYQSIRTDVRRAIRYIEKLEHTLNDISGTSSKKSKRGQ